jgi:hypothetical protein
MVEVAKEFHLTQGTETEHGVVERRNLLDGNLLARWLVNGRTVSQLVLNRLLIKTDGLPDNSICSLAYNILDVVLFRDIEGDFARTWGCGSRHFERNYRRFSCFELDWEWYRRLTPDVFEPAAFDWTVVEVKVFRRLIVVVVGPDRASFRFSRGMSWWSSWRLSFGLDWGSSR